jgi:tight adherence protein B
VSALLALIAATASAALAAAGAVRVLDARSRAPRPPGPPGRRPGPVGRTAAGRALAGRLERGGLAIGPEAFVALAGGAALLAAVVVAAVLRQPLAAIPAGAAVVAAAGAVVRSADRRHLARVEAQLPGIAQQLAAALGAGLSLRQALARAAADSPEPVRAELVRTAAELELGTRLEAALEGLARRVPAHDLRIMVTAILVQRRTGGNLARALSGLSGRLEERGRLARELRGATAQARMTAWLVAALPLAGAVVAELASPGLLARTLGTGAGPLLVAVAGTLYGAGLLAIRRIGRVEP